MLYETIVQEIPPELQLPMVRLAEAMEQHIRDELAVRREDIARIEKAMTDLAEAQKGTEQRVGRLETALVELAEAQKRTELRVEELAEAQKRTELRVEELAEAQKGTEQRVTRIEIALLELTEAQKRTEQRLAELTETVIGIDRRLRKVEIRLDGLVGDNLEDRYRKNTHAYLGRLLRNIKVVTSQELEAALEEHLDEDELTDAALLDLRLRGRIRHHPDAPEVLLAMEVCGG